MRLGVGEGDGEFVAAGVGEAVEVGLALGVGATAAGPVQAASRTNATITERAITP
jgi:hypothetical protein